MDQRYGAWAQLVVLFRMVHDGAEALGMRLPPRHGVLYVANHCRKAARGEPDGGDYVRWLRETIRELKALPRTIRDQR